MSKKLHENSVGDDALKAYSMGMNIEGNLHDKATDLAGESRWQGSDGA